MAEMQPGVTPEPVAPVTPPVTETPIVPTGSEPVQPQGQQEDYKALYEKAKEDDNDEAVKMFYENKAKTDLLTLAVTDPFVKDNFNLVLEQLNQNPMQGADAAAMRVKSNIMDGIIKSADLAQPNHPQNTPTPGAVPEPSYETFEGDEENVIAQMEAKLKGIR